MPVNNPNRWKKLNRPPEGEPWIWLTKSMLESEAWRNLPPPAFSVLMRLQIEHMNHNGLRNGQLLCTYDNFEQFGIRRRSIPKALQELQRRGINYITSRGRRSSGVTRHPSYYTLTWLPNLDGEMPTNDWKRYRSPLKSER